MPDTSATLPLTAPWTELMTRLSPSMSVSLASSVAGASTSGWSSLITRPLSLTASGASLTGVTLTVIAFGVVSKPPALSCTEKLKLA